jgi:hypothetical protein
VRVFYLLSRFTRVAAAPSDLPDVTRTATTTDLFICGYTTGCNDRYSSGRVAKAAMHGSVLAIGQLTTTKRGDER